METEFDVVIHLLQEHRVDFIVVGGVACALNDYVRTTEDLDILVRSNPENIDALFAALSKWGEGFIRDLSPDDFALLPGAVRLEEEFPLDMFTLLAGRSYEDFLESTHSTEAGVRYLSSEALIETKAGSVREKDQLDIIALKRIIREAE